MHYLVQAITLLLFVLLTACSQQSTPTNVKVKTAPAEGLTQQSFDQSYLQNLAQETRQAAEQNLVEYYDRNKTPPTARYSHAQTSGRYELFGKRQLAVVDLSYSANPMRVLRIVGIEQDRLITISCISPKGEPLEIHDKEGDCGSAIAEHFPPDVKRQ
jgi:hypothetical protein